jgi:probable HAF family extracellular repeat protein
MMKRFVLGLAAATLLLSGAARARAEYIVTDLNPPGASSSGAVAINDSGQVVVNANTGSGQQPFLYSNGTMIVLNPPGSHLAFQGESINASGQVVGYGGLPGSSFLYSGGTTTVLPNSLATSINNAGQIVGITNVTGSFGGGPPYLYSGGKTTTLPIPAGTYGQAYGINNSGQVVGSYSDSMYTSTHAFLYGGGKMTDLGSLGRNFTVPRAVNDSGQVVGFAETTNGVIHAFLYSNGKMNDLGSLGGSPASAFALNNAGQVVGQSVTAKGQWHAFLFIDGKLTDLNSLIPADSGWILNGANGINNRGQIVGYGTGPNGQHAFLLTPVAEAPEPTSLALFGLGALGLAGHAWRKRRRAAT